MAADEADTPIVFEGDEEEILDFLRKRLARLAKERGPMRIFGTEHSARLDRAERLADALFASAVGILRGELDVGAHLTLVQERCTALTGEIRQANAALLTLQSRIHEIEATHPPPALPEGEPA